MDAVEFLKTYRRICGSNSCTKCQLWVDEQYTCTGFAPEFCETAAKAWAALSSIGWTVDRAAELLGADKEGHVVVLPCKRGDTVYRIRNNPRTGGRYVKALMVQTVTIWEPGRYQVFTTKDDWFGKTVFLTREEALRRAEDG